MPDPVLYGSGDLPPGMSLFIVVAAAAGLLAMIVVAFRRARERDRRAVIAEASASDKPPVLVEGAEVVLHGKVRHAPGQTVAVRVDVTQIGAESQYKGNWSHTWTEMSRVTTAQPFLLEIEGGPVIDVEPPHDVELVDALDHEVRTNRLQRVCSAELADGELVYATGILERSDRAAIGQHYRDTEWGWVLRPRQGRMQLSSEILGHGLRDRASWHRIYGWLAVVALAISQMMLLGYYARVSGTTVDTVVTSTTYGTSTDSKGHKHTTYYAYVEGYGRTTIDGDDYGRLHDGGPCLVRESSRSNWNLGDGATLWWVSALCLVGLTVGLTITYGAKRATSRPWFRRTLTSKASGRLPPVP